MTNHAVLAGSVLAGVALWAAVYAALLPKRGTDLAETGTVSAITRVSSLDDPPPAPRRWADLPRETATRSSALPADPDAPSTAILSDAGPPDAGHPLRRHRRAQIRATALSAPPLARPRPTQVRPFHARRHFRRIREPIQFSLATRSSS